MLYQLSYTRIESEEGGFTTENQERTPLVPHFHQPITIVDHHRKDRSMAKPRKKRKHKDGTYLWELRETIGGKRRVFYGSTRSETQEKYKQALTADPEETTASTQGKTLIKAFLTDWLESEQRSLRVTTYAGYESIVRKHLIPAFGDLDLISLTPEQIDRFYNKLIDLKISGTTIRHIHAVLHKALDMAQNRGYTTRNVAKLVKTPKASDFDGTPMDREQSRAFLEAAREDRLYALYALALTTGMRQGELLGLSWNDVDLDGGFVRVRRSLSSVNGHLKIGDVKTRSSRRTLPLVPNVVEALREHQLRQDEERRKGCWRETGLVFTTPEGGPLNPANLRTRSFMPLKAAAGISEKVRFHDLRHTAATWMLTNKVNLKLVSEMLGHSSASVTLDVYSHVLPVAAGDALPVLNGLLPEGVGKSLLRPTV